MNSTRKFYTLRAQRVAKVMKWLEKGLELHAERAKSRDYSHMLWHMIEDMTIVEHHLKDLVTRVQPVTLDDIDDDLNGKEGGQGDDEE